MTRKSIGLMFVCFVIFGILILGVSTRSSEAAAKPIVVGFITSISGFDAPVERYFSSGARYAVAQINEAGGVLGRPVKLITKDDKCSPDGTITAVTDLHVREGVDIIVGTLIEHCWAALHSYAKQNKVLAFLPTAHGTELLVQNFHLYSFTFAPNFHAIAKSSAMMVAQRPWTKIYSVAKDTTYGHNIVDLFWQELNTIKPSVKNVGGSWPKAEETDFTAIISAAAASGADACILGITGPGLISFIAQAKTFRFFDKMEAFAAYALGVDHTEALGKDFPAGRFIGGDWCPYYINTPEMNKFVREFINYTGGLYPSDIGYGNYIALRFIFEAMKKSRSTDKEKVIDALEGLTIDSPTGPLTIHDYDHQVSSPMWWCNTTFSKDHPFVIGVNCQKYSDKIYWTKEEVMALRAKTK
jgi:branched-chain amino acid transport system substrate-binding protein